MYFTITYIIYVIDFNVGMIISSYVDYRDRRIIYNIYKEQSAIIQVGNSQNQKEVKQRCPLSSKLFNIFVEQSINEIKETLTKDKIGLIVGGDDINSPPTINPILSLRFADDSSFCK